MKIYTYVSVIYDDDIVAKTIDEPSFYYRTELEEIGIGDNVLVNRNGKDVVGIVIDVEYFDEDKVPYPIEKTKSIIKILESPPIEYSGNWSEEDEEKEDFEYHKISKEDFQKIKEDNVMFITNPGRMGDEDGSTFIVKNKNEFTVYRIDGWMYPKKGEKVDISLDDTTKQFPKWLEAWKHGAEKDYKGKYKYLYMSFGNGLSIDNSIYSEFEPYLNKLIEEYLKDSNEEEKEVLKWSATYNVWEHAFIEMVKDKGYKMH